MICPCCCPQSKPVYHPGIGLSFVPAKGSPLLCVMEHDCWSRHIWLLCNKNRYISVNKTCCENSKMTQCCHNMDNANSKMLTLNTVFTSCRVYRKDESSLKMEGSSKIAASLMIPEEIKLFCNIFCFQKYRLWLL